MASGFSGFVHLFCFKASGVAQTEGPASPREPSVNTPGSFALFHIVTIIT